MHSYIIQSVPECYTIKIKIGEQLGGGEAGGGYLWKSR